MKVISVLKDVLSLTAWEMETPKPYSAFHLALCAAGIPLAVLAARRLAKKRGAAPKAVLFSCGLFLLFLELYKQAFLFFIEFDGHFNWWYFPFQLCSIPMYLCLLYPQSGKYSAVFSTFIQDFGLLGGIMALAVPAGLMHPYWTITLHGFLWHFLLIFLGLYCGMSGLSSHSLRGYAETLPIFFLCCIAALAVNTAAGPSSGADMFYISPFHPSSQPVFHKISMELGIFPGILLYIAAMAAGAFLVHCIMGMLSARIFKSYQKS